MADATRAAIRHGQRLFRAGQSLQAANLWREALAEAYASEDFAGMFVLTKNLGEASLVLAVGAGTGAKVAGLQDAVKYFRYALSLVDQCELWDTIQAYGALQASVKRVETQLVRAELQLTAVEAGEEEATMGDLPSEDRSEVAEASAEACTTCERIPIGSELVLDDADGCYYCADCYEEYYASLRPGEEPSAEEANEQHADGDRSRDIAASCDRLGNSASVGADVVEETIELPTPDAILSTAQEEPPLASSTDESLLTDFNHSHTARIELGSLADVLRQSEAEDEASPSENTPAASVSGDEADEADDAGPTQDESLLEVEQSPSPAVRYTIQELLELRRLVPTDVCPVGLELLPVHKSNQSSQQPARASSRTSKR